MEPLNPALVRLLQSIFKTQIEQDYFIAAPGVMGQHDSVRSLLQDILANNNPLHANDEAKLPVIVDLNVTLDDFINRQKPCFCGEFHNIPQKFLNWCERLITNSLFYVLITKHQDDLQKMINAEGNDEITANIKLIVTSAEYKTKLSIILFDDLIRLVGWRYLHEFFVIEDNRADYLSWCPASFCCDGQKLEEHHLDIQKGLVTVSVYAYSDNKPVHAYEWHALLRTDNNAEQPDAIACGMIYQFERYDGTPYGIGDDMLVAANACADSDLLQVNAFLQQHADAEALIEKNDFCFVWLWERNMTSDKGLGCECLMTALNDIKKRFSQVGVVVIDLMPAQFISADGNAEPSTIQLKRIEAIEKLESYLRKINLGEKINGVCRYIFNTDGSNYQAAERILQRLGLDDESRVP